MSLKYPYRQGQFFSNGSIRLLFVLILLINICLSVSSAFHKSVTVDEFSLLPSGLAILDNGAFQIDAGVPPLAKALMAMPVFFSTSGYTMPDPDRESVSGWELGGKFAVANYANYHAYFLRARIMSMVMLVLICLAGFSLASRLYGPWGGLVAAVFICFSPNLLAHGRLATTDIYLAAAVLGILLSFDMFFKEPSWPHALLLGFMLGIANLCKFTGILFFIILPVVVVLIFAAQKKGIGQANKYPTITRTSVWMTIVAVFFALFIINGGFLFKETLRSLGAFQFKGDFLLLLQKILPSWLPVPVPAQYILGLDAQLTEKGYDAYLLGTFNDTGFWYYYLIGFLVKLPLPLLILPVLAFATAPGISQREIPLLTLSLLMFLFFSVVGHKNIGSRYLLFLIPIGGVWIGRIAVSAINCSKKASISLKALLLSGAVWMMLSVFSVWPHFLPYFNLVAGGSAQGHKYLLDSNLDWGQDLIGLREYMERHEIQSVDLAYFGRVFPEIYGIRYRNVTGAPQQRYAVISANLLWGKMYFINGTSYWPTNRNTYAAFRDLEPETIIGRSLYVYDMQKI